MPKQFPDELRLRAIALLVELKNASEAAAQVMREFPGYEVASQTVSRWGKGLRVKLVSGRRKGSPGVVSRVSHWRDKVADCAARNLSQADARAELNAEAHRMGTTPISRQEVSRYWPRS